MGHGEHYEIGLNGPAGANSAGSIKPSKPTKTPSGDGGPVFKQANINSSVTTEYIVQAGDTFAIIAARLGLTGQAAKEYAKNLKEKLQAEGALNEKGWMKAGQKIELIGDWSERLSTLTDYTTDKKQINKNYSDIVNGVKEAPTVENVKNLRKRKVNGPPTPLIIQENPTQNMDYTIPFYNPYPFVTNGNTSSSANSAKETDEVPNIEQSTEPIPEPTWFIDVLESRQEKVWLPDTPVAPIRRKPPEPVASIKIERPQFLSVKGNTFADALQDKANKENLMAICGLTNEEYNRLAQLSLGIAHEETHFDDGLMGRNVDTGRLDIQWRNFRKQVADDIGYIDYLYESGQRAGSKSIGMTQIKYAEFIKPNSDGTPSQIQQQFEAMGIKSLEDLENSIEKQAIATIIILNNKNNQAHKKEWQDAIRTYNELTHSNLTTERVTVMLYKSMVRKSNLLDGTQKMYISPDDVIASADKFTITSGSTVTPKYSRVNKNNGPLGKVIFMPKLYTSGIRNTKSADIAMLNKLQKRSFIKERDELIQAVKSGKIAFGGGLTHAEMASLTKEDIRLILLELQQYELRSHNAKNNAERREIAMQIEDEFREEYLMSKTVTVKLSNINKHATGYSTQLGSSDIIDNRLVSERQSGVLRAHVRGHKRNGTLKEDAYNNAIRSGSYRGFYVEADKGVNPYYSDGSLIPINNRILAECASAVARDMNIGGRCLTGVKLALEDSGVCEKGEILYPIGCEKTGVIKIPRDMPLYFDAHPEKFEEVKYVEIGNGLAREIMANDIFNLPAGYIVIFIPGTGYEQQAGHALITNGNGQGYADEVDNLRWDNFVSGGAGNGKGENGTFKVYRLRPNIMNDYVYTYR